MFRLIGWFIKAGLFAAIVLVLGSLVRWDGKTVSDQVKTGLAHAERTVETGSDVMTTVKGWANGLLGGGAEPNPRRRSGRAGARVQKADRATGAQEADIPRSERQKLKALIQELNGA